jgi:hypothetical protein
MTNGEQAMSDEARAKYYEYLNELRESGVTNMFGATPYLQRRFGLERREAEAVLMAWMDSCEAQA